MTKLSQPMIVALHEIYAKAIKSNITVKAQTLTALDKRGLITDGEFTGEPAIFLTDAGKEAIGIVTLAEILPGETEESQEVKAEDLTLHEITEMLVGESVEEDAPVPYFNRKARREFRRNVARYNRGLMRLQGKRAREYGAQNVIIKFIAA
jgi:hypothetical protein